MIGIGLLIDAGGQELWMQDLGSSNRASSSERRDDGTLVVASSSAVIGLDEDGTELWRHAWMLEGATQQWVFGTALAPDGTPYVAGAYSTPDGGLYGALDAEGEPRWLYRFGEGELSDSGVGFDAAILSDGSVVFVGGESWTSMWIRKTEP